MGFNSSNKVRVARIGKPHGIRGEVTVELFTDSPETRFAAGAEFEVDREGKSAPQLSKVTVQGSRWHKNILLVTFNEFADRNTAEALRDYYLYAEPLEALENEDAWYADELIGFAAHESTFKSSPVGEVTDLITGSAQDLLEIKLLDGRKVLVPFVKEIVPEIDKALGAIILTPPPGLLELNQD